MKKALLICLIIGTLSGALYLFGNSKNVSVKLKMGNETKEISYKSLGVSVEQETSGNGNSALSSILSLFNANKVAVNVSVDEKMLQDSVLKLYPSLSSPEEAQSSFFIRTPNQQVKNTFSTARIKEDLLAYAKRMIGSEIEIKVIPEEEIAFRLKELSTKTLILKSDGDAVQKREWKIPLKDGGWLVEDENGISISEDLLKDYLQTTIAPLLERPVENAYVNAFNDEGAAAYAVVEGIAKDGITVPIDENLERIQSLVGQGVFEANLLLERTDAYVFNTSGTDLGDLNLIGTGRSNFAGSPEGRAANIQKGLREKMNNIVVPSGTEFSFNSFLGHHLSAKDGWKLALGIFGGGQLRPTLGAGLCQVSTTVYRAILNAGMPVLKRKPHSLYVKYYKPYGEGLDATIYLGGGGPDLVFKNDSPSYIFIQSYVDGDDAYVNFYGTSDGRQTTLSGPYRRNNIPPETGIKPGPTEIVWFRTVHWPDNRHVEENINSRYKTLPKS